MLQLVPGGLHDMFLPYLAITMYVCYDDIAGAYNRFSMGNPSKQTPTYIVMYIKIEVACLL